MNLAVFCSVFVFLISTKVNAYTSDLEGINTIIRELTDGMGDGKLGKAISNGCQCAKYDCGCCLHMEISKLGINDTGCVNVTYLPDQYGISATFSLDGKIIVKETLSAKNPPPLCFGVPHLKKEVSLCVDFYDLDIVKKSFNGCVKIEARLIFVIEKEFDLGCFKIPLPASLLLKHGEVEKHRDWIKMMTLAQKKNKELENMPKVSMQ